MTLPLRSRGELLFTTGQPAIVVEVVEARGSVPRGAGTRMLVSASDSAGTIGGGHLELKAIAASRAMLESGDPAPRDLRLALGPSLGQCCGGAVLLRLSRLDDVALAAWPERAPALRLQLHGAGHVGRAVATLLATLDVFEVDWFDERDDGFPEQTTLGSPWPAHIRRIGADTVEAEVRNAPPDAFYLVLTHEHALDLRIVEAVLRRADFAYLGLIGSKTKRASFEHRLASRGIDAEEIARMTCPIGIDGLSSTQPRTAPAVDAKAPEVIAVAVVAQLLQRAALGRVAAHGAPSPCHSPGS